MSKKSKIESEFLKYIKEKKRVPSCKTFAAYSGISERQLSTKESWNTIKNRLLKKFKKEISVLNVAESNSEALKEETKETIISEFISIANKLQKYPCKAEFLIESGISETTLKRYFKYKDLVDYIKENHNNEIESLNEFDFTEERAKQVLADIKKHDKFVITTAVVEKPCFEGFLRALECYCKANNALLLILPCQDVASRQKHVNWSLDPLLKDKAILFRDVHLNEKIMISSLKMSAKQIKPLTGLSVIAQVESSCIFASPKQTLESVSCSNDRKIPRIIKTTGAITLKDYSSDLYMSQRTSYLAEKDHVYGATIIELNGNKSFYFSNIECKSKDGSFFDVDKLYTPDGKVIPIKNNDKLRPEALVLGDLHSGATCPIKLKGSETLAKLITPKRVVGHDVFNGLSITPYDQDFVGKLAIKSLKKLDSLENELMVTAKEIKKLKSWADELIIVKSNHDEWLDQYLLKGRYKNDYKNQYFALDLLKAVLEGKDPLKYAIEEKCGVKDKNIKWLKRDESYKVFGNELGGHGDKGPSGSKHISIETISKIYGPSIVGHNHGAAIYRQVFRVGTSTPLSEHYTVGPMAWTQSDVILHSDGSRQLITFIGEFFRKPIAKAKGKV